MIVGMFGIGDKKKASTPARVDDGATGGSALTLAEKLISVGIDGKASFDSAEVVAARALDKNGGDAEKAIKDVIGSHQKLAAANGFLTGLGGFATMAVALPANIIGFYLVATRMSAAVAKLRGHDLSDPAMRSAVLLSLIGADANDVLNKAGVVGTGRLANLATQRLSPPALMVVNKAVGFRLIGQVGEKFAARLGKAIPLAGGFIGAGLDTWILHQVSQNARREFPRR